MDADQVEGRELDTRLIERLRESHHDTCDVAILPDRGYVCTCGNEEAAARITALLAENAELQEADQRGDALLAVLEIDRLLEADRLLRELVAIAQEDDSSHHQADYTLRQTIEFDARENAAWAAAFAYTDGGKP